MKQLWVLAITYTVEYEQYTKVLGVYDDDHIEEAIEIATKKYQNKYQDKYTNDIYFFNLNDMNV